MKILGSRHSESLAHPGEIRSAVYVKFRDVTDKIRMLRKLVMFGAFDPCVRECSMQILEEAGAPARDWQAQIGAIHGWVQANISYLNEGIEQFQTPQYTIKRRAGDCDDHVVCACSLLEAIAIPTRMQVIGWPDERGGAMVWRHIVGLAAVPPKKPTGLIYLETTVPGMRVGDSPVEWARGNLSRAAGMI